MVFVKRFLPLLVLLLPCLSMAQFGNEWIKFNQEYYKISVARDSIYRLSYSDLQNAGFPVGSVDPRRLQLFHRGVEQAIFVAGQADASFDSNDYVEFYGRKNNGTSDTELYVQPDYQPHTYYNLYSDTAAYFLTYNPLAVLGKRMEDFFENNVSNIPKETYHIDENLLVLTNEYAVGHTENSYIQVSGFDRGEGWTGSQIFGGNSRDYTLSGIVNGVPAAGTPQLEMLLIGRNENAHSAEISVGANTSSLRSLTTQAFNGYNKHLAMLPLQWTDIGGDGKLTVRVRTPDRLSVSYIKVRYPQATNAASSSEKIFELNNDISKSYVEISNAPGGARLYDITDPNNVIRIGTTATATLNAVIPNTFSARKLLLFDPAKASAARIQKVTFKQIDPSQHDYIIISHPSLMKPASGYSDVVRAYAAYRASAEGGSYDTLVMDIHQIYNQFNYGEISPQAVTRFMKFMINTQMPKYLLLIGKGLDVYEGYHRAPSSSKFATFKDLVPTAGLPGSDTKFTAGLAGTAYEPAVPTGRISATNPVQVAAYLNKVKEMEAMPYNSLWRKNILHLSGGGNAQELEFFRIYLEEFQREAEAHYLGGKVRAVAKQSTDLEFINISEQINQGLNLVTFFGHSAPLTTDIEIGFVTNPALGYNNPGRYPMFLVNGCSAGTFFSTFTVFGEDWINASSKGAIGVLAHSSYGLAPTLRRYSELFYQYAYGDSTFIKKGAGDIQKEIIREYMLSASQTVYNVAQVQQMILLGDPAVRVFGAEKPDYEVSENGIYAESFDGAPVTALTDSFALKFIVKNFGITHPEDLTVSVKRKFSDNSEVSYDSIFSSVLYEDTLVFIVRKERLNGFGNNTFTVTIDSPGEVAELNEDNNSASVEIFIPLSATKNLYPHDFAIVNKSSVDLTFQCTDLLSEGREFFVEVDTVDTFNSAFKKSFTTSGKVLSRQSLDLLAQDSLTYYWRTKLASPLPGESADWATSSFTFINGTSEGWAQMHFAQYLKNDALGLVMDKPLRRLEFEETKAEIFIKNYGSANTTSSLSIKINNVEYQIGQVCRENTINLVAFDKTTSVPYNKFSIFGPVTCGREPQVVMSFTASEIASGTNDIIDYIESVEPGDHVVMFSVKAVDYQAWPSEVKSKLEEIGISSVQISGLQSGEPAVIIGKKGATQGTAQVFKTTASPANAQELVTNQILTGHYTGGSMTSPYIGPAGQWQQFVPRLGTSEPEDEVLIDIIGVSLDGTETILFDNVSDVTDLSTVDAETYPYLRLIYSATDEMNLTPVQLKKWLVVYTPVAEGILFLVTETDAMQVQEGESVEITYGFTNISDQTFPDSLSTSVDVFSKTTRMVEKKNFRIKAPAPHDTTIFSLTIETFGKSGLNDVETFVNRHVVAEQYYDNNVLELYDYLDVQPDVFMPVMDVTIDGRHIANGDYVSSNPHIKISVWDENNYIFKTDTTGVHILLKSPCDSEDCPFERINFTREDIVWSPATDTSDFRIDFTPTNLSSGIYHLMIESRDGNDNLAGAVPYEITFEVSDESSAVLYAPFPNPSNSAVYFTVVISGNVPPEQLELSILNMRGLEVQKLIWEGNMHVGTNVFAWDGRRDGIRVPAGVYLYKLVIRDTEGNEMNLNSPPQSSFFKGGYGKLVLIR